MQIKKAVIAMTIRVDISQWCTGTVGPWCRHRECHTWVTDQWACLQWDLWVRWDPWVQCLQWVSLIRLLSWSVCEKDWAFKHILTSENHFQQYTVKTLWERYFLLGTRLHSSRMRTARALTVSHSMLAGGEGWVSARGGVCYRGGLLQGGSEVTPPVNRITDACKNITLPQLRCGR